MRSSARNLLQRTFKEVTKDLMATPGVRYFPTRAREVMCLLCVFLYAAMSALADPVGSLKFVWTSLGVVRRVLVMLVRATD